MYKYCLAKKKTCMYKGFLWIRDITISSRHTKCGQCTYTHDRDGTTKL